MNSYLIQVEINLITHALRWCEFRVCAENIEAAHDYVTDLMRRLGLEGDDWEFA